MDQELLLHRAAVPVGVAVVVDRGALLVDARLERLDDPGVQALEVGAAQAPGGPERVDARAKQPLVRVDVPDPGNAALIQ